MEQNKTGSLGLLGVLLRIAKGSEHPVHPYRVMPVVVTIRRVMDGVVTGTHDRPNLTVNAVMDVCSP